MNLLKETLEILEKNNKTFDDIEHIVIISEYDSEKNCVIPKDDYLRIAKITDYHNGYGGAEIDMGLMLLGKDFRLVRSEYDGAEWFDFINYNIELPKKINNNPKICNYWYKKHFKEN
jgi:conserved hypothetical protein